MFVLKNLAVDLIHPEETSLPTIFNFVDGPLAMCIAARSLARYVGVDPGATAPHWKFDEVCPGVRVWMLVPQQEDPAMRRGRVIFCDVRGGRVVDGWSKVTAFVPGKGFVAVPCVHVAGIDDIRDLSEAMVAAHAAARAVGKRPR